MSAALNAEQAGALCLYLAAGGARQAVVSPGSRNTPLVLALHALASRLGDDGQPALQLHVVLDERVAAFVALGLARVGRGPVLLCCTSGSAGAHWLPAVVEASASRLPLVLLTADRPPELHGVGAPQTLPQVGLFGIHVRHAEDVPPPAPGVDARWLRAVAWRALEGTRGARPGPVHLNLRFRAPLWEDGVKPLPEIDPRLLLGLDTSTSPGAVEDQAEDLLHWAAGSEGGVLVCGHRDLGEAGDMDGLPAAAAALARGLGWPLLAEASSGVRFAGVGALATADSLVRGGRAPRPDRVLQVGRTATGRGLQEWLDGLRADGMSRCIDPSGELFDPTGQSRVMRADPAALSAAAARRVAGDGGQWADAWSRADQRARQVLGQACGDGFWAGTVVAALLRALPPGALLHAASSMPIRDLDSFGLQAPGLRVSSNRGVNGIDGTLSTALGQAEGSRDPVAVLLGDLAFLHDAGGLLAAVSTERPLTAVVVDNAGGGIFSHLPIAAHPAFDPLFLTPQAVSPAALARGVGARVAEVDDLPGLEQALASAISRAGLDVVVARIDRQDDTRRHREAWAAAGGAWS